MQDIPAGNYSGGVFSPDGKWLVTSSHGEGTHLREVGSWNVRDRLTDERCSGIAFSRDSACIALTYRPGIVLVDSATGRELVSLPAPNPLAIGGVSFGPDGGWLAAACVGHHQIQLWDLHAIRRQLADMKLDWE